MISYKQAMVLHLLDKAAKLDGGGLTSAELKEEIEAVIGEWMTLRNFPTPFPVEHPNQLMREVNPLIEGGLVTQETPGQPFILTAIGHDLVVQWGLHSERWTDWRNCELPFVPVNPMIS